MPNELTYALSLVCGDTPTPLNETAVCAVSDDTGSDIPYGLIPIGCGPVCYKNDPRPDSPDYIALPDDVIATSADIYGLLGIVDVRTNIDPSANPENWTICDNYDFADGPPSEGDTTPIQFVTRWTVQPLLSGYGYGIVGSPLSPVNPLLFAGITLSDIEAISISFDANAQVAFAYQLSQSLDMFTLTRTIAGTPVSLTFSGYSPKLLFDGILQRDSASRDLVVFYIGGSQVKMRIQRDNFATEYTFFTYTGLAPFKLKKTDRMQSYQYLYFYDTSGVFRVARSKVYPPFPIIAADSGVLLVSPSSGAYTSVTVATGPYEDDGALSVGPSSGVYALISKDGGTYSDTGSLAVDPSSGAYTLISVSGGTSSDTGAESVDPSTGAYTLVSVSAGIYTDTGTLAIGPSTGSYS